MNVRFNVRSSAEPPPPLPPSQVAVSQGLIAGRVRLPPDQALRPRPADGAGPEVPAAFRSHRLVPRHRASRRSRPLPPSASSASTQQHQRHHPRPNESSDSCNRLVRTGLFSSRRGLHGPLTPVARACLFLPKRPIGDRLAAWCEYSWPDFVPPCSFILS
jgi:hypothetical protein